MKATFYTLSINLIEETPSSKGSQEWDTLYRKNYKEEVKKLGV